MNEIKEKIINYIKENRVSSTEAADALGKTGAIENLSAINKKHFKTGSIRWVYAYNNSNWDFHEQLESIKKDEIVIVEGFDCENRAIFGDLAAKYILLYKQASAIVVLGKVRDVPRLIKENWPIWCMGYTPIGCTNTQPEEKMNEDIIKQRKAKYDNSIAICDDTGVVVIPKENINPEFYKKLEFIEEQEDIWYDCIDRKKWSTFDTVCKKKYLKEENN